MNIELIIKDIKTRLGEQFNIEDEIISSMIEDYSTIVCNETYYSELPEAFIPYVKSAVIESIQRLGNEGMSSRGELSVSTTYAFADVESGLRSKLKGKKNPRAFLGFKN